MEFNELVKIRRSIRAYTETEVEVEDLKKIIGCAQLAASWKNTQTGRYYVALSEEARQAVYAALPGFNQNSSKNASYIVSTFKKGISGVSNGQMCEEGDLWGAYDLGIQNAYLMLKASDLGYDTLIMGLRDTDALRAYFNIPEDEIIMPVIALGKRSKDVSMNPRKPLDEILEIK